MKSLLLLTLLSAHVIAAQPVLVRVNARTLADLLARDPSIRVVTSSEKETKSAKPAGRSVLNNETILHDGNNWTIVPDGALVYLPDAFKSRVNAKPVGTLLRWDDFLAKNRKWISTDEVTFDQAAGNEELPAECVQSWQKQGKMIVAVHHAEPAPVRVAIAFQALTSR